MVEGRNAAVASWLLFAASALAPLPFGSNQPIAIAFWCIVLGLCVLCAPVRHLEFGHLVALCVAGLMVSAYGLVLHEQLADHPWFAGHLSIWHEAEIALGGPLRPSASIARNQPWFELGRALICILSMVGGILIGTDYRRARQLLNVIAWSGTAYAVYGVVAWLLRDRVSVMTSKQLQFPSDPWSCGPRHEFTRTTVRRGASPPSRSRFEI